MFSVRRTVAEFLHRSYAKAARLFTSQLKAVRATTMHLLWLIAAENSNYSRGNARRRISVADSIRSPRFSKRVNRSIRLHVCELLQEQQFIEKQDLTWHLHSVISLITTWRFEFPLIFLKQKQAVRSAHNNERWSCCKSSHNFWRHYICSCFHRPLEVAAVSQYLGVEFDLQDESCSSGGQCKI